VGTLEPRKNLPRLLEAYALFLDRCAERSAGSEPPDLVLVGARGWQHGDLEPRIRRLQERGKIRLEGYCGPDRLWQHYSSARALLFPSLHEGFGFPILEAMAAKLPVLTSDRGAMREVAGDAAWLVDPENPASIACGLEILHFDPTVRQRLVTAGQHRITLWNWQDTAQKTVSVYRHILAENAARGVQ
jgi:glycosyltransferase involved in cell wall biosynthesis